MTASQDLPRRHLGGGVHAHPLGVRCGPLNGMSNTEALTTLRAALACGATLIDTADCHGNGHAERLVGRLLREHPTARLQVCSKVGRMRGSAPHPYAGRNIHRQCAQSLENLYADRLDVYVLDSLDFGEKDRYLAGAIEQMRALQAVGMVTAIGMRGPHPAPGPPADRHTATPHRFLRLFDLIRPDLVWAHHTTAVALDGEDLLTFTGRRGVGLLLAVTPHQLAGPRLRRIARDAGRCVLVPAFANAAQAREVFRSLWPQDTAANATPDMSTPARSL